MKNLLLTLVAFSILLLIGCQENSITDPFVTESVNKNQLSDSAYHQGVIILESTLNDPRPIGNSYFVINGQIEYEHTLEYFDPIPPAPQYSISLHLSISAELTYLCTVCSPPTVETLAGYISSETDDVIYDSGNGVYLLEKSFQVQGREDGMNLICRFLVTTASIELDAMWLVLPNNNTTNNLSE